MSGRPFGSCWIIAVLFIFLGGVCNAMTGTITIEVPSRGTAAINIGSEWRETSRRDENGVTRIFLVATGDERATAELNASVYARDLYMDCARKADMTVASYDEKMRPGLFIDNRPTIRFRGDRVEGGYIVGRRQGVPATSDSVVTALGAAGWEAFFVTFSVFSSTAGESLIEDLVSSIRDADVSLTVLPATLSTSSVTLDIPLGEWSMTMEMPTISKPVQKSDTSMFEYSGQTDRFAFHVWVDPAANDTLTNSAAFNYYWPGILRNHEVVPTSITVKQGDRYVRCQYDKRIYRRGDYYTLRTVKYYFCIRGRWVDVDISIINPREADQEIFDVFDASFTYH